MTGSVELAPLANTVLWIAFLCMFSSFCYFYALFRKQSPRKRLFHAITTAIVGFASTAYLFMALGYGAVIIKGRIFHYARYIDWIFTTPLLLLDLGHLCHIDLEEAIMLVVLDVLMVLAGLCGGLTVGTTSLWMFLLGCIFFLPIVYDLAFTLRAKAVNVGDAAACTYNKLMGLTVVLWALYPVVFFFAEYSNAISDTFEVLCYGVLDVMAKCVFGFILLSSRESMEQAFAGYESIA